MFPVKKIYPKYQRLMGNYILAISRLSVLTIYDQASSESWEGWHEKTIVIIDGVK